MKLVCLFFSLSFTHITMLHKNVLAYSQIILEQIAQTMVRQVPFKVYTGTYTYFLLFLLSTVNHHSS
jgi:hypothetical protein